MKSSQFDNIRHHLKPVLVIISTGLLSVIVLILLAFIILGRYYNERDQDPLPIPSTDAAVIRHAATQ